MIKRDDRFYTFVITRSNQNRIQIRRIVISKRWFQTAAGLAIISFSFITYSFYSLVIHAKNSELAQQQQQQSQLQAENERNKQELNTLWQRVESVEQISRQFTPTVSGEGGPDEQEINAETTSDTLYAKIHALETALRDRANVPSIYPLIGKINNEFGWRSNPFGGGSLENHPGMDIDGEKGDAVIASADGVVIKAGWHNGYGNLIEISHGNNLTTRYGHLSQIEVAVGETISRGQQIGRVGSTGRSTGPHLHYEVRINDRAVNPRDYLPPEPQAANQ